MKAEKILVVDDEEGIRQLIKDTLELVGYDVDTAVDGLDALEKIAQNEYEAIIADINMPNLDGIGLLRRLRELDEDVSVVMVTGVTALEVVRETLKSSIYDYILKPISPIGQIKDVIGRAVEKTKLVRQVKDYQKNLQNKVAQQAERIRTLMLGSIISLCNALEAKDFYTARHSEKVADIAEKIAREMKLSDADVLQQIREAGLLHDLGKIGIPDAILLKNGELSPDEYDEVKKHPLVAEKILQPVIVEKPTLAGIRHHHERYDGSGYPNGLAAQSIPLTGRILACADCYDAIFSNRPYRNKMTEKEAIEEIKRVSGTQLDPDIVSAFLSAISKD